MEPANLPERLQHAREAKEKLGSKIPWLVDAMDNRTKHAFGNAPNSEFLIGPDGKIVSMHGWSDPNQLRRDLEKILGKVSPATQISDLNMKVEAPPKLAPSGIVPRLNKPGNMTAISVKASPILSIKPEPLYIKLRPEADNALLQSGNGKLYLGFFLDPLHHVHWNNLVAPIKVEVRSSDSFKVTPSISNGPKVNQPSDIDPREFIIDVTNWNRSEPMHLNVSYFACNDDEGWCRPMKQSFTIHLSRDGDAGRPIGNRSMGSGRQRQGTPPPHIIKRFDTNGDGQLDFQERMKARGQMRRR